jgi:hypothetical protein
MKLTGLEINAPFDEIKLLDLLSDGKVSKAIKKWLRRKSVQKLSEDRLRYPFREDRIAIRAVLFPQREANWLILTLYLNWADGTGKGGDPCLKKNPKLEISFSPKIIDLHLLISPSSPIEQTAPLKEWFKKFGIFYPNC